MDFLEYVFHISPDAGNGAAELSVIALAAVAITTFSLRRPLGRVISLLNEPARLNRQPRP